MVSQQIVIMGSGETSPTMVTPHQRISSSVSATGGPYVLLDTPFGFQENADELVLRLTQYFTQSVGIQTTHARIRSTAESAGELARATAQIREASWVFAGPGSPSYALQVWRELGISQYLAEVPNTGALVMSSAAALTMGTHTVPVYEIYKVGQDPHWLTGMNILGQYTGLQAAVIPHFDNAEGGTHDTRYCYMGERRLRILESQLPEDVFILGVDEHTGATFDLSTRQVHVFGRGGLTVRRGESQWVLLSGQHASFDDVAEHGGVHRVLHDINSPIVLSSDAANVEHLLDSGDVLSAVDALLALDELDRDVETRATVHALISRLGHLAASPRVDIKEIVGPYIDVLLQARQAARSQGHWAEADSIRDNLQALKVIIRDSSDGSSWNIETS